MTEEESDARRALNARLAKLQSARIDEVRVAAAAFARSLELRDLLPVLARARELEVVSDRGLHLDVPDTTCRVRFKWGVLDAGSPVLVELTDHRFVSLCEPFAWKATSDTLELAAFLARELERRGLASAEFDPERLLRDMCTLLHRLIDLRCGAPGTSDFGPAIHVPSDNWAVTDYGVECLAHYYPVQSSRLSQPHWVRHVSMKIWAVEHEVEDVFEAARLFFENSRVTAPTPAGDKRDEDGADDLETTRAPRVFIASSSEALPIANSLQLNLDFGAEPTVWTQDIFSPTEFVIESLARAASDHDYGVFVFAPDDIAKIRGQEARVTRDNVVFELGLFIGKLGRQRCFVVMPRGQDVHLPSDLAGIVPLTYNAGRSDGNLQAALGPAANKILAAIGHPSGHRPVEDDP